jgi:hypothetical protein
MHIRRLPWLAPLALLALVALPAAAPAQEKPEPPALIVRVRSLENLFESGKLLFEAAGKGQVLKQIEDLIKSKAGPKGLAALDARRPLGLYARVGKDLSDLHAVLLVPVADEKGFLELLDALNLKSEKPVGGVHRIKQNALPFDLHFRFAHQYAYMTPLNPAALDPEALLSPAKLFPAKQTSALSLTLHLQRVPGMARQVLLQHLNDALDKALESKEKPANPAQQRFRDELVKELIRQLTAVVREGDELNATIDIDPKTRDLTADLTVTARPGTSLATMIEKLGEGKSLFTGLLRDDAAVNALVHYRLPERLRQALVGLIKEATRRSLAETTDEAKQKQVRQLIETLEPTFKSGAIDLAFSLRGPSASDRYTLVGGVRLEDGKKVAATLVALLKDLPKTERPKVKFNVEKVDGTAIHSLDLSKGFDELTRGMFGEEPLYLALKSNAAYFALGEDGLKAIKEALTAPAKAGAPLRLEVSLVRLAAVMARTPEQLKAAKRLLTQSDEGRVRLSLEGGERLRLRFVVNLNVVRLLSRLGALEAPKKE